MKRQPAPSKPVHPNDARFLKPHQQAPWDRDDQAQKAAQRKVKRELFTVPRATIKRPW